MLGGGLSNQAQHSKHAEACSSEARAHARDSIAGRLSNGHAASHISAQEQEHLCKCNRNTSAAKRAHLVINGREAKRNHADYEWCRYHPQNGPRQPPVVLPERISARQTQGRSTVTHMSQIFLKHLLGQYEPNTRRKLRSPLCSKSIMKLKSAYDAQSFVAVSALICIRSLTPSAYRPGETSACLESGDGGRTAGREERWDSGVGRLTRG